MKTKTLFSIFIIAAIFSSCTTTLQQRRVADELYENPDTYTKEQVAQSGQYKYQAEKQKDTIYHKDKRYGYSPYYGPRYGYVPHRWYPHYYWPDWYYWDFYPHYPFYGYGYPWYGSAFFGYHSYWYSPYFGHYSYYPYYPYNYTPYSVRSRERKLTSNSLRSNRIGNITAPHTQRIRKVLPSSDNKSLSTPNLRIPSDRKARMPLRTIRAIDGNRVSNSGSVSSSRKRMNYIRPSNIQGSSKSKYNIMLRDSRQRSPVNHIIRKRAPVYRSPARSVNRVQQIRPSRPTRNRK